MVKSRKRKVGIGAACTTALLLMACCAFGVTAQVNAQSAEGPAEGYTYATEEDLAKEAATSPSPRVYENERGQLVQITPASAEPSYYDNGLYLMDSTAHNNLVYLRADERGCNACHTDLAQTVYNMGPYYGIFHTDLRSGLDTQLTYVQCIDCHRYYSVFEDAIHTIHASEMFSAMGGDCWSCHITNDGEYVLWDEVKYEKLRGITDVANVEGEFVYDQDTLTDDFDVQWVNMDESAIDDVRYLNALYDVPLDQEMFDTWEVSVVGEVETELVYTLPELIELAREESGLETRIMKKSCNDNPLGGGLIANSEVTGISLRWLAEKAGVLETATSFVTWAPNGYPAEPYAWHTIEELEECDPLLIYELNGEPISWEDGYPLVIWLSGGTAGGAVEQVTCIEFSTYEVIYDPEADGWTLYGRDDSTQTVVSFRPALQASYGLNKPNVAFIGIDSGTCIQAGEPYTFEGYADAWDERITSVEFSMDGGATWTRYPVHNTDTARWVHWTFTWTPPADCETSYVLMVRDWTEEGHVTSEPIQVMVNAKIDLEQFRAETVGE